jgi:hypothetical protein
MDKKKISKLKKKGWKVGNASEFLKDTKKPLKTKRLLICPPSPTAYFDKIHDMNVILLKNIKDSLPKLKELLEKANGHWYLEDYIYRYYHGSFKVYYVQSTTVEIVKALIELAPEGVTFNRQFKEIFKQGTGKIFSSSHNANWDKHTRPMLEAFFHAKYFLEMAVKYGEELKVAPTCLPSGWACLLYFFSLR